jgi:hypothetical protein
VPFTHGAARGQLQRVGGATLPHRSPLPCVADTLDANFGTRAAYDTGRVGRAASLPRAPERHARRQSRVHHLPTMGARASRIRAQSNGRGRRRLQDARGPMHRPSGCVQANGVPPITVHSPAGREREGGPYATLSGPTAPAPFGHSETRLARRQAGRLDRSPCRTGTSCTAHRLASARASGTAAS